MCVAGDAFACVHTCLWQAMSSLTTGASAGSGIHLCDTARTVDASRSAGHLAYKGGISSLCLTSEPLQLLRQKTRSAAPSSPTQFQTSAMFCATLVAAFLYTFSAVALLAHGAAVNEAKRGQSS